MVLIRNIAVLLVFSLALISCGSGSGGVAPQSDGSTDAGTDTGTDTGEEPVAVSLALGNGSGDSFVPGALAISTASIPFNGTVTATASVVDENSSNALSTSAATVNFTSTCSGTEIPDATITSEVTTLTGVATATYVAQGCTGNDTITATLIVEDTPTDTASATVSVGSLALGTLEGEAFFDGQMNITASSLSFGGSTGVSVNVVEAGSSTLFTSDSITVNFTSLCSQQDPAKATITPSVDTQTGLASATYNAEGCVGDDIITASIGSVVATSTVNVAIQDVGAIKFVSAEPSVISLVGIGSSELPETSDVTFEVVDKNGLVIPGLEVSFSLSSTIGGVELSLDNAVTDEEGLVRTTLNAGSVNTTVRVIASLVSEGVSISTTSNPIAMHSGLPDQDSFSVAASILNPRAAQFVGFVSEITSSVADEFNNPVPNGTSVSFVTDGGRIEGSCFVEDGACSVDWTGQNPHPNSGYARILARSTGQESFVDTNGNGMYDLGETISEPLTTEAYLDENRNGQYDVGEFFSDFDNDGVFTVKTDGKYQGASCSDAARADGHCATLVEVRREHNLCMATDHVLFSPAPNTPDLPAVDDIKPVFVTITDGFSHTPASGTTISISADGDVAIKSGGTQVVPNECSETGVSFSFEVERTGLGSGTISIDVTQVDGVIASYPIRLDALPEPVI